MSYILVDGIYIDMRSMNKVEYTSRQPYEKSGPALRLGPGSTWSRVIEKFPIEKFTYIHGACTGVGVGGFLLGGGFNYGGSSRRLGSGSLNVLEYTLVDANGDVLKVVLTFFIRLICILYHSIMIIITIIMIYLCPLYFYWQFFPFKGVQKQCHKTWIETSSTIRL